MFANNGANHDLKQEMKNSGFCFWQIAKGLGIADTTFSRKLREELPVSVPKINGKTG